MTITQFDRTTCKDLQQAVIEALKSVEQKYGVAFAPDGGKFDDGSFTMKLKARVTDAKAAADHERNDFLSYCRLFDYRPEHYLKVVVSQGKQLQFVGFAPKRIKYPLKMRDLATGKVVLYTDSLRDHILAA